jgi:hypothetical protein
MLTKTVQYTHLHQMRQGVSLPEQWPQGTFGIVPNRERSPEGDVSCRVRGLVDMTMFFQLSVYA